ncbi:HET-domain-containing protein [Hyaloscypha variabilis F]|uniref:HET-domain-containing protein n=1 Tax=Hyaloscypha variabilis (strain UAMH 11265 / GT02V1 / F) TaxID=1149755 RepID=A0A2J6RSD5_HYAVF|nr:HET-domain-containing protein [Hyaloscypha variabilis F]
MFCTRCRSIDLSKGDPQRPSQTFVTVNLTEHTWPREDGTCATCYFFSEHHRLNGPSLYNSERLYLVPFRTSDLFWDPFSRVDKPSVGKETISFVINWTGGRNVRHMAHDHYFLTPSVLDGYPYQPFRHANLGETVDFNRVRGFLDFCQTHHDECKRHVNRKSSQPIRVINCHRRNVVWLKGWCEGSYKPYVTLSYVWGNSTKQEFKPGPSLEEVPLPEQVPALIEDSMKATLGLGYSYLWIDYYCIDQSNSQEVEKQVEQMDAIYSNSVATLITPAARDPSQHIPRVGEEALWRKYGPVKIGIGTYTLGNIHSDVKMMSSLWGSRGWTYQEAVLAGRRVVFGKESVWVQCHRMVFSERLDVRNEDLSRTQPRLPDAQWYFRSVDRQPDQDAVAQVWTHIREYSLRELSKDSDGLRAFFGILRALKEAYPDLHHISGLPLTCRPDDSNTVTEKFINALTWYRLTTSAERIFDFPSWSWLGWKERKSSILSPELKKAGRVYRRYPFDVSIEIPSFSKAPTNTLKINDHSNGQDSTDLQYFLQHCPADTLMLDTIPFIEITAPTIGFELTESSSGLIIIRMADDYKNLHAPPVRLDRHFPESTATRGTAILLFYDPTSFTVGNIWGTVPHPSEWLYMLLVMPSAEGTGVSERIGLIRVKHHDAIRIVPTALKNRSKILLG